LYKKRKIQTEARNLLEGFVLIILTAIMIQKKTDGKYKNLSDSLVCVSIPKKMYGIKESKNKHINENIKDR
jgi:hypothetical protein